ncbi:META domain-containing protein [Conexibacter sp. CPCC 206217]|uniref:META domain-containing protein n=1 Tax=Conexibacter sp. CPCC 206217 TaxID=3064574 RepID=UPI0027276891|nr:META domain-containing protein [Conexibacter sp. CPCC 206217]MDO8211615.1 META domain-containing protein [Conexibacter sp. CPCC 206217]
MRRTALAIALLGTLLLAAGCGSSDDDQSAATTGGATTTTGSGSDTGASPSGAAPNADDLNGRTFVSTAVTGHELVPGTEITLGFEQSGLGVKAGCNSMGGAYALEDGTLRWAAAPATTMIGCEAPLQRQDEWLTDFLAGGAKIAADGERLTLERDGVTIELREGTAGHTPPPIAGTNWTLETIAGRDGTAASVPAGVEPPTLRFADGRAEVFAGCNRGGGSAQLRDDGFAIFGPLALTEMACDAPAMRLEQLVTAILRGRAALGFDGGGNLTVAKNGQHLVFRAG